MSKVISKKFIHDNDCSPQMLETFRLERMAKAAGFAWENPSGILNHLESEIKEVRAVLQQEQGNRTRLEDEAGDVFMTFLVFCYHMDLNPEDILRHSNQKFAARFGKMQEIMADRNITTMQDMAIKELLQLWEDAKKLTGAAGED